MNFDGQNKSPLENISDKEIDAVILKLGSFLSIMSNKKCNQAKLLISSVKDKAFGEVCVKMTVMERTEDFARCLLNRYPSMAKSKLVYNSLCK